MRVFGEDTIVNQRKSLRGRNLQKSNIATKQSFAPKTLTAEGSLLTKSLVSAHRREMAMPARIMTTPITFLRLGCSWRISVPNRKIQMKLVAVMHGKTETFT